MSLSNDRFGAAAAGIGERRNRRVQSAVVGQKQSLHREAILNFFGKRRSEPNMKLLACFAVLITVAMPSLGQETRPYELSSANKRLNSTYQQILRRMDSGEQEKLKKAQRAWISYRDLDCAWAFSSEPLDCQIQRTEERITALEDAFFRDKAGNYTMGDNKKK